MAESPDKRFSLVADLYSRDGGVTQDARMQNAFAEEDGRVWQRPGLGSGALGSGGGQGLLSIGDSGEQTLFAVTAGTLLGYAPTYSISAAINTAVAGQVALLNGATYRINFFNGAVYRAPANSLTWQLVSTSGFLPTNQSASLFEAGGYIWGYTSENAADWEVRRTSDGVTWGGTYPTGEGSRQGFMAGLLATGYKYPTTFTNGALIYAYGTGSSVAMVLATGVSIIPSVVGLAQAMSGCLVRGQVLLF